jgi:nucleotide-binding universal stress UspA family protein
LGSTAKKLASIGTVPLLIVRETSSDARPKRILAAVDGSEHALGALRAAAVLAKAFDAQITLLHVVDTRGLAKTTHPPGSGLLKQTLHVAGRQALEAAGQLCEQLEVGFDVAQVEGRPAQAIFTMAQDGGYDMVAVGRRGVTGLAGLFLGSVSDEVIKRPVPLILLS